MTHGPVRPPLLGQLESSVMELLWAGGDGEAKAVHAALGRRRGITLNTIQSTLKRLFEKGLLSRDKVSHAHVYRPRVDRQEYQPPYRAPGQWGAREPRAQDLRPRARHAAHAGQAGRRRHAANPRPRRPGGRAANRNPATDRAAPIDRARRLRADPGRARAFRGDRLRPASRLAPSGKANGSMTWSRNCLKSTAAT
jgi:DNA-binding HxlR family transcriptional regulator